MAALALSPLDAYRPALEAMDDVDWYVNEAESEMGLRSSCGPMLECIASGRALVEADSDYPYGVRPGVYGRSLSGPWEEEVAYQPGEERTYVRQVWGRHPKQTRNTAFSEFGEVQKRACEMSRNVAEVLWRLLPRDRLVLLTHHTSREYSQEMRQVFGQNVRLAPITEAAGDAFTFARLAWEDHAPARRELAALPKPLRQLDQERIDRASRPADESVLTFLEGVALRHGKHPRAGEKPLVEEIRKEAAHALRDAYARYEDARFETRKEAALRDACARYEPTRSDTREQIAIRDWYRAYDRLYPYKLAHRRARRLNAAGP